MREETQWPQVFPEIDKSAAMLRAALGVGMFCVFNCAISQLIKQLEVIAKETHPSESAEITLEYWVTNDNLHLKSRIVEQSLWCLARISL